jgi:hypothetical protein
MNNPLQQYFRQPKIFIKLPSEGLYNKPGTLQGDVTNMPVYGMTGMDEIIIKTPDSLLTGASTASMIVSCCPAIKDAWELSSIDLSMVLAAIRIATYGETMNIRHICTNCGADNEFEIELNRIIEHYMTCKYDNSLKLGDLIVKIQPLTYRQSTEFSLKNFRLQQQISQVDSIEDKDEQQEFLNKMFRELAVIQNDIYKASVEAVETPTGVVTDKTFIAEWIEKCEKDVFDAIKAKNQQNASVWELPKYPVKCDSCGTEVNLIVDLDQSSFFARA